MVRLAVARAVAALASVVVAAAACTSTPPPAAPPTGTPTSTTARTPSQIVIGVDDVKGGYNPHHLADVGQITSVLGQLLLPSVYRTDDAGRPKLDKTVMRSAKVIKNQPFTVAYEIRRVAAWSDGAPIAAEDFSYLADAMRTEPGTVDPAGYRLISEIVSREGGKRVEVAFKRHYPGWRALFAHLLPAHLLKDTPGGWQAALQSSFPAYGGPFSVKTLDTARGEVLLERNERYWDKPAAVDQLVLRESDRRGLVDDLRGGSTQLALRRTNAGDLKALKGLGGSVELHTVTRPEVAEVLLRPWREPLKDPNVRAGVAALIDRARLAGTGIAGGPSEPLRADAQVLAPSERGYGPTVPATWRAPDPERAKHLLAAGGYTNTGGRWQDGADKPLRLVIASPGKREPYATLAEELARQLRAAGVAATAITPDSRELFGGDLAGPPEDNTTEPAEPTETPTEDEQGEASGEDAVDIVVAPRVVGADPAAGLASRFGCPQRARSGDAEDPDGPELPANPTGFCDRALQPMITAALTGGSALPAAIHRLEPDLWQANLVVPLFQVADTLALSEGVSGVSPGPPMSGPFGSAVNWIRTGR